MSQLDIRNYGQVIERLVGPMVEKERPREAMQSVLKPPEHEFDLQIIQQGTERYYSEALVDRLLDENYRQRRAVEGYRQTFEETDVQVTKLLLRLGFAFAVILTIVAIVMRR